MLPVVRDVGTDTNSDVMAQVLLLSSFVMAIFFFDM